MENKLAWLVVGILIVTSIWAVFKLFEVSQSEKEWMEINSEYTRISHETELCIFSCKFEEDLRPCFDVCDQQLNSSLEAIGIKHDAWRKKYS